jgi:ribosome-associated protein
MKKDAAVRQFSLGEHEFITLTNLLKVVRLVGSGGEANQHITDGAVQVNGVLETQKRKKLRVGDHIAFGGREIVIVS